MKMPTLKSPIKTVLFDLDGTLLDTAADLGMALNDILLQRNLIPLEQTVIRSVAGRGCKGLLKLGLDMDDTHPDYADHCVTLLANYEKYLLQNTAFFPGIEDVLLHLEKKNIPWGIVTNKPQRFTTKILQHLQLDHRAAIVVSGDTLAHSKPHPAPILHACSHIGIIPAECLYIGDAEVDIIASRAAGTSSLVALYGYIEKSENPQLWQADGFIQHPAEIPAWLSS
jgi:2-phosphoglycolate phosphatase